MICAGLFLWTKGGAQAQTSSPQPSFYVRKAKEAMALGKFPQWKQALEQAETAWQRAAPSLPLQRRNNLQLWIWLLWSKYYRVAGETPPVVAVQSFDDKAALGHYIQLFTRAIAALQRSRDYLKRYNRLLAEMMQRSRWRDQIYLQASLSLQRDVEGEIRTAEVYTSFLRYVLHNWGNQKKIAKQVNSLSDLVKSKIKQDAAERKVQKLLVRRHRRQVARVMLGSEKRYRNDLKAAVSRRKTGTALIVTGAVVAGVAAVGVGVGAYLAVSANQGGNQDVGTKQQLSDAGTGLLVGGGILVAVGVTVAIVGGVLRPPTNSLDHATIRNHNRYLDVERKRPTATDKDNVTGRKGGVTGRKGTSSRLPAPTIPRHPAAVPLPGCRGQGCRILGQW